MKKHKQSFGFGMSILNYSSAIGLVRKAHSGIFFPASKQKIQSQLNLLQKKQLQKSLIIGSIRALVLFIPPKYLQRRFDNYKPIFYKAIVQAWESPLVGIWFG